jgi:hypothetical protein
MDTIPPRRPVVLDDALPTPGVLGDLARQHTPHRTRDPLQVAIERVLSAAGTPTGGRSPRGAQRSAQRGAQRGAQRIATGTPGFRTSWSATGPLPADVAAVARNPRFVDAASDVFKGYAEVRPDELHLDIDLSTPMTLAPAPVAPAFRGLDARHYPAWFRTLLHRSRLFEDWRIPVAVAVTWEYPGPGGGFAYLPEGRLARPSRWRPPFANTAIVIDADALCATTQTSIARVTRPNGLSATAALEHDRERDTWSVVDPERGTTLAVDASDLCVAAWWTALVFRDADAARVYDEHSDDLDAALVADLLAFDLRERGYSVARTRNPVWETTLVGAMVDAYDVRWSPRAG